MGETAAMAQGKTEPTFLWHDYETFGADPRRDRRAVRRDPHRQRLQSRRRTNDVLLQAGGRFPACPKACLITGITPQAARRRGLAEMVAARIRRDGRRHLLAGLQHAAFRRRSQPSSLLPQLHRSVLARMAERQLAMGPDVGVPIMPCVPTASSGRRATTARRAFVSRT